MKTERIQQFKKAFTLYRRGGYSLAYRWKLYLNTRRSKFKRKNFLTFLKNTRKELEI